MCRDINDEAMARKRRAARILKLSVAPTGAQTARNVIYQRLSSCT